MESMKNKFKIIPGCFTAFMVISVAGVLFSATLKVPQQYKSIFSGLLKAQPGDTVLVAPGLYFENIALVDNVVLTGENQKTTIIDGRRKGPVVIGADNAVLDNFTITNGTIGILCKATVPTIRRCIIIDNKGSGIQAIMSLPDIRNNIIMRNKWTGVFCQSVKSINTSIEHNVIIENGYSGIHCANVTQILVQGNVLGGNDEYGVYCDQAAQRTRIINNNFLGNMLAPASFYSKVNKTNLRKDPKFNRPSATIRAMDYFCRDVSPMKGAGPNGTDIGLMTEEQIAVTSSDQDNDGIPDISDQCPEVPEDVDGFEDMDGCPDYDNDKDGIYDRKDNCRDVAEDKDGFEDMDGCPDEDNDQDGIPDVKDACPSAPETQNGFKDDDGCPDDVPQAITRRMILQGVNFKTASAELLDESYPALDLVYNSLESFPNVRVEIAGHTDSIGPAKENQMLSFERAKTVKEYLSNRGIDGNRIVVKGYGEDRPIASNNTADGRRQNRRVEITPLQYK
jgi:outer membrane protein OmpA-like peptidoglycan-associated protein